MDRSISQTKVLSGKSRSCTHKITCLETCKILHTNVQASDLLFYVIKLVFFTHMPQANISLALANPQGRWHHIKLIAAGLSS